MSLAVTQVVTWFSPKEGQKGHSCFGPFQIKLSISVEISVRTDGGFYRVSVS